MPPKRGRKEATVSDGEKATGKSKTTKRQKVSDNLDTDVELSPDAGALIVGGGTDWNLIGRSEVPKGVKKPPKGVSLENMWGPHLYRIPDTGENVRVRAIATSCTSCHSALMDGKVYTWGRNENGQLGMGDTNTRYKPTLVEALQEENIVQVATGRGHTLFLTDKGEVFSCGANKMGQLGLGNQGKDKLIPEKIKYSGKRIVKMSCGAEFSMIVDMAGNIHSFGSPEYGQLGHNTEGKRLEKAGKFLFTCETSPRMITQFLDKDVKDDGVRIPLTNVVITDLKCGFNHTIARDTEGRVFTWGFGAYGRLGHSTNKDEFVPRLVKILENFKVQPTVIAVGSTFSFVSSAAMKLTYFFGQQKNSGAATMYPQPFGDLNGWNVKHISCGHKSIVVVADESVISWGPSPTYGELLYGDTISKPARGGFGSKTGQVNSSSAPVEVKTMTGIQVRDVSCGYGHTLMIVDDLTKEQRTRLSELPSWPVGK